MGKLRPHQAAGILIFLLGIVTIVGWWTQRQILLQFLPGFLPMVFNAALCFVLAGAALMLPESKPQLRRIVQQAAGILIICVAGSTGAQNLANADFGIDQLFAKLWFDDGNPHPGRMAPLTSLGFVLAGGCFLLVHRLPSSKTAQVVMQVLTHIILGVAIFSLVGYPLRLESLYHWYRFARMAPQTGVGFIILGGALWLVWYRTLKQSGVYDKREDKRIAALATVILFVLALTGGLAGFVLSTQPTEATLRKILESALVNRTQFLGFVISDSVKMAESLASDPALRDTLQGVVAKSPGQRNLALEKLEEHLLGGVFSGVAVLSLNGETLLHTGTIESYPPMSLPLREDAILFRNRETVLQVGFPVFENNKQVGTIITQRALPDIDKLLSDARLLGASGDIAICASLSRNEMRCLPTRLVPQGYLSVARRRNGAHMPASLAIDGQSGVATVRDGRGEQVVAAYGPVAGFALGVVVKQDTVELYEPIRAQLMNLLILLTLMVASALLLLRSQLLPLVSAVIKAKRDADMNEAKIRSVVENIADGLITIDERGAIESINPAASAMFGYSSDEVVGANVDILIPSHLKRAHAEGMESYLLTGKAGILGQTGVEVTGLRKNGAEFPMQISIREMRIGGERLFVGIVRDIGERRQVEQAIRKAHERFLLVSQATNDVIWDLDFETMQTWWNEGLADQFGYGPEKVEGAPAWWKERIHPDDRAEVLEKIKDEIDKGEKYWVAEYRFLKADGTYAHVLDRGHILRDSNGTAVRMIGAMMDVTEHKEANDRLRQSETRFSTVFNLCPVAISITRISDGHFVDVNDALLQMLGYTREEMIGNTSVALDFWLTPEERIEMVERIQHIGSVRDFPIKARAKEGGILDLLIAVDLVELAGSPYLFCFLTNITERKRAEEALRDSEEKFRSIVETTKDWIWSIDPEGRVLYANPAVESVLGYTPEELQGTNILTRLHPAQQQEVAETLSTLVRENATWSNMLLCWHHKDGRNRYTQSTAIPMLGDHGELLGYRGSDHDVTELKRFEYELQEAKEKAELANQAKSEFLANMSHEIRTPMNGVIGLINLVLKTPLSAQQADYLRLVKISADSLLRLLNDILDFSKMEARKLELDVVEFDLRELLGDTLKAFSASANEKGLELTYHVAMNVPATLLGDPGRLTQIIVNLAGNAIKFTHHGEVVVRVSQESSENGCAMLHFTVSDTGIGISPEQQTNIFNAFAQADSSTTRQFGGTGLGLAIVSQLVALMDGRVWVDSEAGNGTRFHFTARLNVPSAAATAVVLPPSVLKNMAVLVVDDNRSNRLILAEILISWGMCPVLAAGGEQALAEMQREAALGRPFPLVLLDSQMPQIDGFQLAQAIKSAPAIKDAALMMLSSSDMPDELPRSRELGITGLLRKPVKPSELFNAIVTAANIGPIDKPEPGPGPDATRAKPARRLNILVAEDHPINQILVAEILTERGHTFSIANNGIEALHMLDQQSFDVILMDGQMPEMDGYQATAEIRRRERSTGKHIHIVAVTAHAMKEDRDRCMAAGMDDYVSKPIDPEQLLERLEIVQTPIVESAAGYPAPEVEAVHITTAFNFEKALRRARGKHALLQQLAHLLLQDLPDAVAEIRAAVDADDAVQVERAAHRLRGAAVTVSAEPLADAAYKLEQAGRDNAADGMQKAALEVESRAAELAAALEAFTGNTN
ncbi:MAG: hypothetical protein JWQ23_4037 [Herminiimonas sp.]|nr:hypothetical protein [Herminiimonas sp.]